MLIDTGLKTMRKLIIGALKTCIILYLVLLMLYLWCLQSNLRLLTLYFKIFSIIFSKCFHFVDYFISQLIVFIFKCLPHFLIALHKPAETCLGILILRLELFICIH